MPSLIRVAAVLALKPALGLGSRFATTPSSACWKHTSNRASPSGYPALVGPSCDVQSSRQSVAITHRGRQPCSCSDLGSRQEVP
jgi:hypothetical protein